MRPQDEKDIKYAIENGIPYEHWPDELLEVQLQELKKEFSSIPDYDPQDEEHYIDFNVKCNIEWEIHEIEGILHPLMRPLHPVEVYDDEELPF